MDGDILDICGSLQNQVGSPRVQSRVKSREGGTNGTKELVVPNVKAT